jgi:hypothetical protein
MVEKNPLAKVLAGTWKLQVPYFSHATAREPIHVQNDCENRDLLRYLLQCYRMLRKAFLVDDVHESWKQWTRKLLLAAAAIARSSVAGFARARIVVFATVVVRVVVASVIVGVLIVVQ